MQNPMPAGADLTSNDKLWSALSYVFTPIVPAIALMMDETKNRPFPRFHATQALGVFAAVMLWVVLASVIFVCGTLVTFGIGGCILWVLFFVPLPLLIYYAVQAYNGLYFSIPVVTDFMVRQGWLRR